ncbi:MAG: MFS transporter [bacterium]|nr:MFS transporter [bacterium]
MDSANHNTRMYTATFALAFLYNFFNGFIFTNNALFPLYVSQAGGGPDAVGLFMAAFPLAGLLGRPLHGAMIDRWGVRRVMMIGSGMMALSSLGFIGLLGDGLPPLAWGLRLVQGFGFGAHMSAFFTLAGQMAPRGRRNEAIIMYGISGMAAGLIGPAIGEWIIRHYGLAPFFILLAVMGLCSMSSAWLMRVKPRDAMLERFTFRGVLTVLLMPSFRICFLLSFCVAISFTTMSVFIAPLMEERGVSHFGLFFTSYAVCGIAVRLAGRKWADRYGYMKVIAPGFLFYGLGLLVIQASYSLPMVIAAGMLCGLGHGLSFPVATTLGYILSPEAYRGAGVALNTGMMDLGNAVTALVLGKAAALLGYHAVYLIGAIGPLFAFAYIAFHGESLTEAACAQET